MPISPLHVLFYQSSRKSKNVQISIFFCFTQFSVNFLFIVPMLHLQLHFRLSFSGGLGNTPTSGIGYVVFIQCTPIPCLLLFGIFLTGKIHFSGAGTKIKWIEIENIFLYKFQVKKCPIFNHKKSGSG